LKIRDGYTIQTLRSRRRTQYDHRLPSQTKWQEMAERERFKLNSCFTPQINIRLRMAIGDNSHVLDFLIADGSMDVR